MEYGLDELKRVFEIADNFIKKGKGSTGTLRRNLTKQLEKHGAQMTGMRMKICNELLREGMKTYGAIQQSAEKCEDSEDDYSELIESLKQDIEYTAKLIKRDMNAWVEAKNVYYNKFLNL